MKFTGEIPASEEGDRFLVTINDTKINAIYSKRMMNNETGEWVVYPGSSFGLPELGKVRQDGAKELHARIGDIITLETISR